MKSPAAVYKLPGSYDFRVILKADYSERRHIHADAPAIVHAREISIQQQVLRIIIFFSVNMSAPPFSFIGFCEA